MGETPPPGVQRGKGPGGPLAGIRSRIADSNRSRPAGFVGLIPAENRYRSLPHARLLIRSSGFVLLSVRCCRLAAVLRIFSKALANQGANGRSNSSESDRSSASRRSRLETTPRTKRSRPHEAAGPSRSWSASRPTSSECCSPCRRARSIAGKAGRPCIAATLSWTLDQTPHAPAVSTGRPPSPRTRSRSSSAKRLWLRYRHRREGAGRSASRSAAWTAVL